jgi:hypothetical protein
MSKSGVFCGFADNHEVEARIADGSLDAKAGRLRLSVDSRKMRVLDAQLPSDKQQQVQARMLGPKLWTPTVFRKSSLTPHVCNMVREEPFEWTDCSRCMASQNLSQSLCMERMGDIRADSH